jgi:Bacteriophage Sf6, terminase small subunit-like
MTEADMIEHRKLQIDSRKWLIGKMAPKKNGDKQQIEHAGPDGGPVTVEALVMASLKKE